MVLSEKECQNFGSEGFWVLAVSEKEYLALPSLFEKGDEGL